VPKNRNQWILWIACLIGELGLWFALIGNLEFMQQTVPSSFLQSLLMFAGPFVAFLLSPLAGRIIDSHEKKKILIVIGLIRLMATGFMFLAVAQQSVVWMLCYAVSIGGTSSFYGATLSALLPLIVREEELLEANSAQMNASTIARIAGAGIAGLLVVTVGLFWMYVVNFFAYAVLLALTCLLKVEEQVKPRSLTAEEKRRMSFREVLPLVRQRPTVMTSMFLSVVPFLFLGGFNLNVIAISELHGSGIKGVIYTLEGIAFLLGSSFVKKRVKDQQGVRHLFAACLMVSTAQLALHVADVYAVAVSAFAVFGFAVGMFFPLLATLQQTQIPKEYHGRFFSFRSMVDTILIQAFMMNTGFWLDRIGLLQLELWLGLCSFVLLSLVALRHRKVREVASNEKTPASSM
jgi:MFS family permease